MGCGSFQRNISSLSSRMGIQVERIHEVQDPNELRIKTARMLGRQNLQLYKDRRLSSEEISKEFEWNKQLGISLDQWKSGTLVYDDEGRVLEAILEREDERAKIKKRRI